MAVSGLLLLLFAIFHMLGHLQMFGGQDMYNAYAHFLLIVHTILALALTAKNRAARKQKYAVFRPVRSSWVGRSMAVSGIIVLAFLIFHILHFTIGQVQPGYFHQMDPKNRWDAYSTRRGCNRSAGGTRSTRPIRSVRSSRCSCSSAT